MTLHDCIIIGAGYAGLAAAKTLHTAHQHVLVLEARSRIGGRVMTQRYPDGTYLDCGGSYLGRSQPRMYALATEFNIETFDAHVPGKIILSYRGKLATYEGLIPPLGMWELLDVHLFIKRFERLARGVDVEMPWKTVDAIAWDNMTMKEYINKYCWARAARDTMNVVVETIWGVRAVEISVLHALFYSKAGVDLTTLCTSNNGAQHQLIKGGAQVIADRIRDQLGDEVVHVGEPVVAVDQASGDMDVDGDVVTVTTSKASYQARRVIIATPPPEVLRISFNPPLPHPRRTLLQHFPMGSYWKYLACYKTAFWREKGLSGEVTSPDRLISVVFDASPTEGTYAVLMAFVVGQNARTISSQSKEERKEAILKDLAATHGEEAKNPFRLVEHTMMDEPYIGGCPVGTPAPGMWTTLGPWLKKPFQRVHWAGTETSSVWNGYMEGAVASGQRAAEEVLSLKD